MINFTQINPMILSFGPVGISWYSLSYVTGIMVGWYYINKLILLYPNEVNKKHVENFISWAVVSIIIGGRLGYVFFYDLKRYITDPIEILKTYKGGMSFHGGIVGITLAVYFYCRKNKIGFFSFSDLLAVVTPIGLFGGRIANFINAELYGRRTNVFWAVIFPYTDGLPRHPSQLYEAFLEGVILFLIMLYFTHKHKFLKIPGKTSGIFLIFYSTFRILIEFFREPDPKVGFFFKYFTLGQILCVPMIGISIFLLKNKKSI